MGRWIKALQLTPEMMEKIDELLIEGMFEKHVQGLLGIAPSTWQKWKKDARELEDNLLKGTICEDDLEDDDKKLIEFLMITKKGRNECIRKNLANIQKAGTDITHWQASAWYLERVANEEFGRVQTNKIQGAIGLVDVELSEEDEAKFKANLSSIFGEEIDD